MATEKIKRDNWKTLGSTTGKTLIPIDTTGIKTVYIQIYYQGYVVPIILPVDAFSATSRTVGFSYATTSNVPFYGNVKYSKWSIQLGGLYDYTGTDVSSSAQIDILGK